LTIWLEKHREAGERHRNYTFCTGNEITHTDKNHPSLVFCTKPVKNVVATNWILIKKKTWDQK